MLVTSISFKQLTQGSVLQYNVCASSYLSNLAIAFCSACTALQESRDSPGAQLAKQPNAEQCGNLPGTPLYPVDNM